MYIRELELSGFKSFVTKTRLEFTPGLTAVVGPNGSGKSNLVDAIRWVLGEHNSRLLRASRMDEVIFNGTRRLKPLGRAEVSLTIDNGDGVLPLAYQEVRITRRLYRSGEAEYLLNQTPCRLRDIQQLLWDTGVGKHGFAIISQGQVEELLAVSPEERRGILEEVAGIVRYRHRRRDAEQKLAETEGHLLRLHDLMAELASQSRSLEREVKVAKEYQALQESIGAAEKELGFWRLQSLGRRRQELSERLGQLEAVLADAEARCSRLEKEIEQGKQGVAALGAKHEAIRAEQQQQAASRQEAQIKLEAGTRELSFLAREDARLDRELEAVQSRRRQIGQDIAASETELQELVQRLLGTEAEGQQISASLALAEEELKAALRRREEQRARLYTAWQDISATQNELRALEGEWQASRARGQRLYSERQRLQEEKETVATKLAQVGAQIQTRSAALADLTADLAGLRDKMGIHQDELAQLGRAMESARHNWQQRQNRLTFLRELQQTHEGYGQGVRAVLQAQKELWPDGSGIIGVVAELLEVPRDLETAIEAALGGALQHLVARTEADAQRAIAYLKAGGAGRATFLPLDAIQPRRLGAARAAVTWAGVIGVGAELVTTRPECAAILPHLMGDLLVVSRLDLALTIARRLGYRVRLVTVEGDLVQPGGSLTGGRSKKRGGGLLSRLREIADLSASIEGIVKDLAVHQEQEQELQLALAACQEQERQQQERLWAGKAELGRAENERQELVRQHSVLEQHLAVVGLDLAQWEGEFKSLTQRRAGLESRLTELQKAQEALSALEQEPQDDYCDLEARRAQYLAAVEENRARLAALAQQQERLRGSLEGLYELRKRLEREETQYVERLTDLAARTETRRQSQEGLRREIETLEQQERERMQQLAVVEAEKEAATAALRNKEKELLQTWTERRAAEKDYHQVHYELKEEEADWKLQVEWLQRRCGWREGDELPELLTPEEELKALLSAKESAKERLGPVDLSVLAEYNRLQERHAYMSGQAEDLEAARVSLSGVVAEVERLMEEQLSGTLEAVNKELGQVYPALFGGGKAWLATTGEGRLLNQGLDLVVQVPGKRVPNLALLSGGERALAAIAVLFALLQVKPSPFCVLDEIDASLDDANVEKFAHFLRRAAARQQFIIVSHRAGTVQHAHTVYGVTMEEEGVSRLVSLCLPRKETEQAWQESAG